jgi:TetR/AcrR family transcriptional regulator
MSQQRDLNRTRERIMAAAQKEFAAHGFAGARTDTIARRARVNERMIFYCFDSKEGLYKAVLAQKLSAKASIIESTPDGDFPTCLVRRFATTCADIDALRMWQWEALDRRNRKLVAEEERRAYLQSEVERWRQAKAAGSLPADADVEILLLVSVALCTFPLAMPQVTSLVTGMDPLDPEFQRKWSASLEWIARQLLLPIPTGGNQLESEKAESPSGQNIAPIKAGTASRDKERNASDQQMKQAANQGA